MPGGMVPGYSITETSVQFLTQHDHGSGEMPWQMVHAIYKLHNTVVSVYRVRTEINRLPINHGVTITHLGSGTTRGGVVRPLGRQGGELERSCNL